MKEIGVIRHDGYAINFDPRTGLLAQADLYVNAGAYMTVIDRATTSGGRKLVRGASGFWYREDGVSIGKKIKPRTLRYPGEHRYYPLGVSDKPIQLSSIPGILYDDEYYIVRCNGAKIRHNSSSRQ